MLRPVNLVRFYLTIDLRSLALFRILLGVVWIIDWFGRWPDLEAFYTADGILPNFAQLSPTASQFHYSILVGATTLPVVQVIFLLGLLCYVCFLLGLHTRAFHLASLVFFGSVLARNPIITHGGDSVMFAMALWTLFLPLGSRWSFDALRSAVEPGAPDPQPPSTPAVAPRSQPSLAAFAAVAQLGVIYTFSAFVKNTGELWRNGTALYYALNLDNYTTSLGHLVAQAPLPVIQFLTYGTLVIEWAGLPLILLPWLQPWLRRILIVVLGAMHVVSAVTMELWTFPWIMLSCYALLLDERDWNVLTRWTAPMRARLPGHSAAWRRLVVGWFGAKTTAVTDGVPNRILRWRQRTVFSLVQAFVVVVFVSVLVDGYNLSWARPRQLPQIAEPHWMRGTLEGLQLVHGWYMFAPNPMTTDGWWVINGLTENGMNIDPLTRQAPTWQKPEDLLHRWGVFWQMYLVKLTQGEYHQYRTYLGNYLTLRHRRNSARGQGLTRFDFYYVAEPTLPPGSPKPFPATPQYLWSFNCGLRRVDTQGPHVR